MILTETPLVSAQFCWNELYKYKACEFCLRSLETAEEMSQRLTENPALTLPHPECCAVDPSVFSLCPQCQVDSHSLLCTLSVMYIIGEQFILYSFVFSLRPYLLFIYMYYVCSL